MYACYIAYELGRIFLYKDENSMAPLYLSFLPFIVFQLLLRDAHIIFTLAWFTSLMTNNLQIGITTLRYHVIAACVLFIVIYSCLVNFVAYVFASDEYDQTFVLARNIIYREQVPCSTVTNEDTFRNLTATICQLGYSAEITPPEEITYIVGIILITVCFLSLEEFINAYAMNILHRSRKVHSMEQQNEQLKNKLHVVKKDVNLDLDSPITKVIKSIKSLQDTYSLDVDVMESLDYVIQILSSNQLFMPNLDMGGEAMDSDVKTWLTSMIAHHKTDSGSLEKKFGFASLDDFMKPLTGQTHIPKALHGHELKISELLETIDQWDFDLFELERLTNGAPLYYLAMAAFQKHGFIEKFNLDEHVVRTFFRTIESKYRPLSYHSALHAADVLHAMHFFLSSLGVRDKFKEDEIFAGIIAAAIHDVDHPGYTNAYLITSSNPLALRYNDIAVLESHHCATAFELMAANPACNILGKLPADKLKTIRGHIVSMVLATDMSNHFEFIAKFKIKAGGGGGGGQNGGGLDFDDVKDRQLTLNIFIKCGDISNAAKSLPVCKKWAYKIMEEFFKQGDEEKKNGYPVSMFMDRKTTFIPKCQVGFVDYIVIPLYEALDAFLHSQNHDFIAISNLVSNRDYWKAQPVTTEIISK
ncbi:hypothetical protein BDR26DRAFT_836511 [Obelidium mucronatum]|nr:hypothetical protein BDR26DRAFT_836511 [Obelidium mucronatum]